MQSNESTGNSWQGQAYKLCQVRSVDFGQKEWTSDIISKQVDALTRLLQLEKETIELIEEEFKTFVS